MKTYAVLLAPEFRLQAALRLGPSPQKPAVLIEHQGAKVRVVEVNAQAEAHQVCRGMSPTQALARFPGLQLIPPNPGAERSAQDILLQMAERLSPDLETTAPGLITIGLPEDLRLPDDVLMTRCLLPLKNLGLQAKIGIAKTPDFALLAARMADPILQVLTNNEFLHPLPIATLQPSTELQSVLHSWGIRTIGEFLALPQAEACQRLGLEALELWERARGGKSRPLKLIKPREFYTEQLDLEHPMQMLEPLLFLLRRFLEQITLRLHQVYLVVGKLRLTLRFENQPPYHHVFVLPQPTLQVDLLFRMLHTHLENFKTDSAVVGVGLSAQPVRPTEEQFSLLEKGLRDPHRFAETLARLQALLGPNRVGSPRLVASHHPEAFEIQAYDMSSPITPETNQLLFGVPWLRFRPAVPARVVCQNRFPTYLHSTPFTGDIIRANGPWILEGTWWDTAPWSREDWDVATEEGCFRLSCRKNDWFVEGIYA